MSVSMSMSETRQEDVKRKLQILLFLQVKCMEADQDDRTTNSIWEEFGRSH
jgi:Cdc6-like AAA superfamily ATPase